MVKLESDAGDVWVNPAHVASVREDTGDTVICFATTRWITVSESPERVVELLEKGVHPLRMAKIERTSVAIDGESDMAPEERAEAARVLRDALGALENEPSSAEDAETP